MTIRAILKWKNSDSTADLNSRFSALFGRGVLTGGLLTPVTGQLKVAVQPFTLMSNDGLLVVSDDNEQVSIPLDQTNIVCLLAKHNIGADPTLSLLVIEASVFNALLNKDDHIVLGAVTTASPATQVATTDISYALRDIQDKRGRSSFRGWLSDSLSLPTDPNYIYTGDYYIITAGGGDPPAVYAWDGLAWINITNTTVLASDIAVHRANGFPNEIHLTNNQADAALGSSGSPSLVNRYVTESDTRLPTQSENDALVGSDGVASSTNKYITQEYGVAAPVTLSYVLTGTIVPALSADGPFFVGTGAVGSANKYFSILDDIDDIGYTNSNNLGPRVIGVYKDLLLTQNLNPSVDADSNGFFSSDLYLSLSYALDTPMRLLYGKLKNLKTISKDFTITATPGLEIVPGTVVEKITNIKGRTFNDPTPTDEQNINLALGLNGVRAYIGSVLETNAIAADEDFNKLSTDPYFSSSFVKNVGISDVSRYANSPFVSYTYNSTLGRITYSSPVSLGSVVSGDVFTDGVGRDFKVTASNGTTTVDIVSLETGAVPSSASVSTGGNGNIRVNNNPRDVLLSEMKLSFGAEIVRIPRLNRIDNEFSKPDGNVAYGVLRSDGRFDPRIVFYGGWQNYQSASREQYVRNDGNNGSIILTGFFTDVSLLMRRRSNSPALNISIDGQTSTAISTSALGQISSAVASSEGAKWEKLVLASGLPSTRPNTVSVSIASDTAGSLDIFGFELSRSNQSNAFLESGRAFKSATIISRDAVDAVSVTNTGTLSRGGRLVYSVADNSYGQAIGILADLDLSNTPSGTIGPSSSSIIVTAGTSKLDSYRINDVVLVYDIPTTSSVMRRVSSITANSPSPGQYTVALDSTTSMIVSTTVVIRHICSTDNTIPNTDEETLIARYDLLSDQFKNGTSTDFAPLDAVDRFVVHRDGHTIVAGQSVAVSQSGIVDVDKAVIITTGGSAKLKISALCTRLDLIAANSSMATADITIDGSPAYSYTFSGVSAKRRTIFFNARYQHHEVIITPTSGTLAFTEIVLFGPKKPSLAGFQNEVADLSMIARYEPSRSTLLTAPYTYPVGGVFYEAAHYISYIDSAVVEADPNWTTSFDFSKAYYGNYYYAARTSAIAEFYFLGTAFELQYLTDSTHGHFEVFVDGVEIDAIGGATIVGTYSGKVDGYSAIPGRKNIGIYGLSYGYHKVEAKIPSPKTTSGSSYRMAFTGYYVCNEDGYLCYGISREGYYTSAVDLRNFIPLPTGASELTGTSDTRAGKVDLTISSTSISVTLSEAFPDNNYAVTPVMLNTVDGSPVYQPVIITAQSGTGFTASWNSPLLTGNYKLVYTAKALD